ncbi:MAG: hypothetical protein UW02_C0006G0003 [Candidatus Nomurabacteria bacterium GW2011_GWB1_43_7]|uniref:Uncharacterized protein n=1 Tax=Candidatus Nomurabacteria bacterium GW2011_GWB1_43_7 TaxID=1618747 RepID=A0A0G1HJ90_9BACT|nr:MAG: hypothetical protein UW02_C0006G0003 [Candidatus Nomurabacteria bacterium GW2011_GWB1_43_7]
MNYFIALENAEGESGYNPLSCLPRCVQNLKATATMVGGCVGMESVSPVPRRGAVSLSPLSRALATRYTPPAMPSPTRTLHPVPQFQPEAGCVSGSEDLRSSPGSPLGPLDPGGPCFPRSPRSEARKFGGSGMLQPCGTNPFAQISAWGFPGVPGAGAQDLTSSGRVQSTSRILELLGASRCSMTTSAPFGALKFHSPGAGL